MPNREGRYGGYQPREKQNRQVRAPGSGGVRRVSPGQRPVEPQPVQRQAPRSGAGARPSPEKNNAYRAPYTPPEWAEADGWQRPPQPQRPVQTQAGQGDPARQSARSAARKARQNRRARRRLTLIATGVCILLASGVITVLLPNGSTETENPVIEGDTSQLTTSVVAPLPYAEDSGNALTEALNWGDVGPARQTENYTYTAAPSVPSAVPEFGKVDLSWFNDAAFLGDSLTVGYTDYDIDVGDALVCAYEGASPNDIVNRTTMTSSDRGEEIPLDVLSQAQPKKLYVLLGANSLAYSTNNDEGFLNYYGRMLDELKTALPDTTIFVQSVLPVQAEVQDEMPGLTPDRVNSINASLSSLAAEKGCLYLALNEVFVDESGSLKADYAQPDGLHLSGSGYSTWVEYLRTHVPYDKDNPYQLGSTYYLSDEMRELLSDLP